VLRWGGMGVARERDRDRQTDRQRKEEMEGTLTLPVIQSIIVTCFSCHPNIPSVNSRTSKKSTTCRTSRHWMRVRPAPWLHRQIRTIHQRTSSTGSWNLHQARLHFFKDRTQQPIIWPSILPLAATPRPFGRQRECIRICWWSRWQKPARLCESKFLAEMVVICFCKMMALHKLWNTPLLFAQN